MILLLNLAIDFVLVCLVLASLFCAVRLLIGPSTQDRILALDTLWICVMLIAVALGLRSGSQVYFDVALLIALLGFVSTIALAKFLIRGEIIE